MPSLIFRIALRSFAFENAPNVATVISKTVTQIFFKFCQLFTYDQIKQHIESPSLMSFFEFEKSQLSENCGILRGFEDYLLYVLGKTCT